MQSKVDHLMMFCSADSFRLNGLFQPLQATVHTHLLQAILRVSLIKIRCGVWNELNYTPNLLPIVLCSEHTLSEAQHTVILCECTEGQT